MIEVQSLMIGNYVWDNYSGYMEVSLIDSVNESIDLRKNKTLPSGRYIIEDIEPIPLTEEWLEKFGFDKGTSEDGEDVMIYLNSHWKFILEYYNFCQPSEDNGYYLIEYLGQLEIQIKHIHQLQNLYFALTSEELTIKE